MAKDTITVNHKPSCGYCKKEPDYNGYKEYTKTWKNKCTSPTCNKVGTLTDNPKGVPEGELTCSACDADYCGFCGNDKAGGGSRFKLIAADAENKDSEDNGAGTGKDMLLDLITPLDGEVELRCELDTIYVNKIPDPKTYDLGVIERYNLIDGATTVHDYNPETINHLKVIWSGGTIERFDNKLINRFGEKILELEATKKVTTTKTEEISTTDDEGNEKDETSTKTSTETVPVTTKEEAEHFVNIEWAKIRRDNGHQIECQVIASKEWKQGKWTKVLIPEWDEDCVMYVTKVNDNDDDSWTPIGLTLVDYPPSLSKETQSNESEEDDMEDEDMEGDGA
jgi:hypothetical protein